MVFIFTRAWKYCGASVVMARIGAVRAKWSHRFLRQSDSNLGFYVVAVERQGQNNERMMIEILRLWTDHVVIVVGRMLRRFATSVLRFSNLH